MLCNVQGNSSPCFYITHATSHITQPCRISVARGRCRSGQSEQSVKLPGLPPYGGSNPPLPIVLRPRLRAKNDTERGRDQQGRAKCHQVRSAEIGEADPKRHQLGDRYCRE